MPTPPTSWCSTTRAAKELWEFSNLLPVETPARVIHTEPSADWWKRGEQNEMTERPEPLESIPTTQHTSPSNPPPAVLQVDHSNSDNLDVMPSDRGHTQHALPVCGRPPWTLQARRPGRAG